MGDEVRERVSGILIATVRRDSSAVDLLVGRAPFAGPELLDAYALIDSLAAAAAGLAMALAADHGLDPEAFLRALALTVAAES